MRRLLLIIVLLAGTLAALAQNGLKGRVIEAAGTPVMYAAVMLDSGETPKTVSVEKTRIQTAS